MANKRSVFDFDGVWDDMFGAFATKEVTLETSAPPKSTWRTTSDLAGKGLMTLEVDLPGIEPGDVKVFIEGDRIVVEYTRPSTTVKFTQRYTVAHEWAANSATARMSHGQLKVFVMKRRTDTTRIEVAVLT
jgi:HSP20 family molecular chaperone IbpA